MNQPVKLAARCSPVGVKLLALFFLHGSASVIPNRSRRGCPRISVRTVARRWGIGRCCASELDYDGDRWVIVGE